MPVVPRAAVLGGLLVALGLASCHKSTSSPAGGKCWDARAGSLIEGCDCAGQDSSCSPAAHAFCDPYGACQIACSADGDCGSGRYCDLGICVAPSCASAAECPGAMCLAGRCGVPAAPASCVVEPKRPHAVAGRTTTLYALALDDKGEMVASRPSDWSWSAPAGGAVTVAAGVVTGISDGTATVTAHHASGVECTVDVRSLGPVPTGSLRALVVDDESGRAVVGATVAITDTLSGAALGSGATDPTGIALVTLVPGAPASFTATVFSPDHEWISLAGATATDLFFPLRHTAARDVGGGFKGSFTDFSVQPPVTAVPPLDLRMGVAAASVGGSPLDLDLDRLLGPAIPTRIALLGRSLPIPSGVALGLGQDWYTSVLDATAPGSSAADGTFGALGMPGECADDLAEASGACGLRTAWTLAGLVATQTALDAFGSGDPSKLSAGSVVGKLLPYFERFRSAIASRIEFQTRPFQSSTALPDFANDLAFPARTADFADPTRYHRLALNPYIPIPVLPRADFSCAALPCGTDPALDPAVGYLQAALVLGGAWVPQQGMVGLGLTAGVDQAKDTDPRNGIVNDPTDSSGHSLATPAAGVLSLHLAPEHSGIEGSPYVLLALALSFDGPGSASSGRRATSGLVRLVDGPIARQQPLPLGDAFLGFADNISVDPVARTVAHVGAEALPAAALRIQVSGGGTGTWTIYYPAGQGTRAVLPSPADYQIAEDRLAPPSGGHLKVISQALDLRDAAGTPFGGADLFQLGERSADRLLLWVRAFSSLQMP